MSKFSKSCRNCGRDDDTQDDERAKVAKYIPKFQELLERGNLTDYDVNDLITSCPWRVAPD